ncbi:Cyclin-dependent kinase 1 [Diplonema papillatum]|nr:Cyclin-dependent kinase 1 [Diplonema papillatum]
MRIAVLLGQLVCASLAFDWVYFPTSQDKVGTPTIWNGVVYAITEDPREGDYGDLISLDETNGLLLWPWEFSTNGDARLQKPVVYIGEDGSPLILAVTGDQRLSAIDADAVLLLNWTYPNTDMELSHMMKPSLGNRVVYTTAAISDTQYILSAVDAETGPRPDNSGILWSREFRNRLSPALFVEEHQIVVVAMEGEIHAYNTTGGLQWLTHIYGSPGVDASIAFGGKPGSELVFVTTMEYGAGYPSEEAGAKLTNRQQAQDPVNENMTYPYHVYAINGSTGNVTWARHGEGCYGVSGPVLNGEMLFITSWLGGGNLTKFNASSGDQMWAVADSQNAGNVSSPVAVDGVVWVLIGTQDTLDLWGFLWEQGDLFWSTTVVVQNDCPCTPDFPIYPPSVANGTAFIPGIDGRIYAITLPTVTPSVSPSPAGGGSNLPSSFGYIAAACGIVVIGLVLVLPKCWTRLSADDEDVANMEDKVDGSGAAGGTPASRYVPLRRLGCGSYGTVYEVRSKKDGRSYALKRIPCDSDAERKEAIREWRFLCSIQHPNKIVAYETFMNWGVSKGEEAFGAVTAVYHRRFVCIVMEYHSEGDLKHYIQSFHKDQQIPEQVIMSFAGQLCSLLAVLHSQNPPLMHRDLKPENILLDDDGTRIVVTDFGLARRLSSGSYCKTHAGTLAFIAPETWDRHYSTGADMWAAGCIMYALMSKRVCKHDVRCLWREASNPTFQTDLVHEAKELGYSEACANIMAQFLTPDRKRRTTAVQAMQWFTPYLPNESLPTPVPGGPVDISEHTEHTVHTEHAEHSEHVQLSPPRSVSDEFIS